MPCHDDTENEALSAMDGGLTLAGRQRWAEGEFGAADLGDARRPRRLVKLAAQMAGNSSGTIPQQTGTTAAMRAAYRLFAEEDVTHEAVCRPHWDETRQKAGQLKMVFLVQDTTELNFTMHVHCQGLSPIGHGGKMQGLHQQNVLAVDPMTARPLGLMYQRHHHRKARPAGGKRDRAAQRRVPLEERESYWWVEGIREIGPPPPGTVWVHVGDRAEDLFGVYDEARRQRADWLVRIAKDRRVTTPDGPDMLFAYARGLDAMAHHQLTVRRKGGGAPEEIKLSVAAGKVTIPPSQLEAGYRGLEPITCLVVRVWEKKPPKGKEPLEWLLCTSLPCATKRQALFVAKGYSLRWIIEEFHKCEKTGCQVEMRRLEHVDRLEPLIGLLSVLAVRLLGLKYVARDDPQKPARTLFADLEVGVMARYMKKPAAILTVGEFWRGIGRLGGHPGRNHDGPLGWLRAWRGWQSFQLICFGAELATQRKKKCG